MGSAWGYAQVAFLERNLGQLPQLGGGVCEQEGISSTYCPEQPHWDSPPCWDSPPRWDPPPGLGSDVTCRAAVWREMDFGESLIALPCKKKSGFPAQGGEPGSEAVRDGGSECGRGGREPNQEMVSHETLQKTQWE